MTLVICNDTHYRQAQANWFVTRSSRARSLAVLCQLSKWRCASQFSIITISSRGKSLLLFSRCCRRYQFLLLLLLLVVQKCYLTRWLVQIINRCCCFGRNWNSDRCAYGIGIRSVQSGWLKKCASSGAKKEKGRGKIWTRFPIPTNTELASSGRSCMSRDIDISIYLSVSICSLCNRTNMWMSIGRMSFVALWNYRTTNSRRGQQQFFHAILGLDDQAGRRRQAMEWHCSCNNMVNVGIE